MTKELKVVYAARDVLDLVTEDVKKEFPNVTVMKVKAVYGQHGGEEPEFEGAEVTIQMKETKPRKLNDRQNRES